MTNSHAPILCVCAICGSDNIRRTADVIWNEKTQQWEISAMLDSASCEECGDDDCKYDERPLLAIDTGFASVEGFLAGFADDPYEPDQEIATLLRSTRAFRFRAAGIEAAARSVVGKGNGSWMLGNVDQLALALSFREAEQEDLAAAVDQAESFLEGFIGDELQEGISEMIAQLQACRARAIGIEKAAVAVVQGQAEPEPDTAMSLLETALAD